MSFFLFFLNINRIYKKIFIIIVDILISQFLLLILLMLFTFDYGLTREESWYFFYIGDYFNFNTDIYIIFLISLFFLPIFLYKGIYNSIFRYLGLYSFVNLFNATIIFGIFFIIINYLIKISFNNFIELSFLFFVCYIILFYIFISLHHFTLKLILHFFIRGRNLDNILIYGAGSAGYTMSNHLKNQYKILGFIDDDASKIGTRINNIQINSLENYLKLINSQLVKIIYVTIPSISFEQRKYLVRKLLDMNIPFKFLNLNNAKYQNEISTSSFETISINDLIDRKINWDPSIVQNKLKNKTILVTGAGGSIGSELSNLISTFKIKKLILIDHSEINLYNLKQSLNTNIQNNNDLNKIQYFLGSIQDLKFIEKIFIKEKPNLIYHAAAYKHVALCEDNIIKCLENNFIATIQLLNISIKYNLDEFIFISTDKAVKSTNIMGCSKRLSEMYINNLLSNNDLETKFSIIRFGNVIGSTGSVFELFQKQISNNGPLTLTHPDATRYFMTPQDAVRLVLQSSSLIEKNEIFILKMGKPINIKKLAIKMINGSGKKIKDNSDNGDIEIKVVGLHEGEKLHEELVIGKKAINTSHPDILKEEQNNNNIEDIVDISNKLKLMLENNDEEAIYKLLYKKHLLYKIN